MTKKTEDNQIQEILHPEAPVSCHIDGYYKGFHIGVTMRDPSFIKDAYALITNAKSTVEAMIKDDWKPSWNEDTNKAFVPNQVQAQPQQQPQRTANQTFVCSVCGAPAEYKEGISKKTNKPYRAVFCSTGNKDHARFLNAGETPDTPPVQQTTDDIPF